MITKKINGKEYLFVEVPEDAVFLHKKGNTLYFKKTFSKLNIEYHDLKGVKFKVVGKADTLSEEQIFEIGLAPIVKTLLEEGMEPKTTLIILKNNLL